MGSAGKTAKCANFLLSAVLLTRYQACAIGRRSKEVIYMNSQNKTYVVTGAGGFIGGALVAALRTRGCGRIRAVDNKPFQEWYQLFDNVENLCLDLNQKEDCETA